MTCVWRCWWSEESCEQVLPAVGNLSTPQSGRSPLGRYHLAVAITEVTRRALLDELRLSKVPWSGRLEEPAFLGRIYPLTEMPSYDSRDADAVGDIYQHRVRNLDWDDDWVF